MQIINKIFKRLIIAFVPSKEIRFALRVKWLWGHKNNSISVIGKDGKLREVLYIKGLRVGFHSDNNRLIVDESNRFYKSKIVFASTGGVCSIGKSATVLERVEIIFSKNSKVEIEDGFTLSGGNLIIWASYPDVTCHIGKDSMFSRDIIMLCGDGHVIQNKDTGEIVNKGGDIYIGNHVWVCARSVISKNSFIAEGSIVGVGSFVNKKFEEPNSILAGVPAKILRANEITWRRENHADFKP